MRGVCPACIVGVKVTSHIGREKTGGDLFLTICDYEWKPLGFLRGLVGGVFTRIPDGFGLSACGAMFSIPARTKRHAGAASVQRRSRRPDERVSRAREAGPASSSRKSVSYCGIHANFPRRRLFVA
ncbi:hypothetical protein C6P88_28040 [Burkholderia contaminans]|nr:hypothetical protein C6P88_28040 [Burkholderia contaminans]